MPSSRSTRVTILAVCFFPFLIVAVLLVLPFFAEGIVLREELVRLRVDGGVETRERLLEPGGEFRGGDALAFTIESREPIHLYAFAADAAGAERVLFPDATLGETNPLPPGRAHELPGDAATGRAAGWRCPDAAERLFCFVYMSLEPIPEADALAARLLGAGKPPASPAAAVQVHLALHKKLSRQRGVWARRWVLRRE